MAHSAGSQVRTTKGPQGAANASSEPESVGAYSVNLIEEEAVSQWCHLGDGNNRKRERCGEASRVICDSEFAGPFPVDLDVIQMMSRTKWIMAVMESLCTTRGAKMWASS